MLDNESILYGLATTQQLEMDDEDFDIVKKNAEIQYDYNNLLDSIGTSEFKETYLNFIISIQFSPLSEQQILASNILQKIQELYNYEFSPDPDIITSIQIKRVYELISFIEYDNIDFISTVWQRLNIDLKDFDFKEFCKTNTKRVTNAIEKIVFDMQFGTMSDGMLTKIFLRTYYKNGLLNMFSRMTEKNKQLIILKMREGELYGSGEKSIETSNKEG